MLTIDRVLDSTKPIVYETGCDDWPYAFSGTCYPVKYNGTLFIISAFHCYKNFGIDPKQTLYPRPNDPTCFFAFDLRSRAQAKVASDDEHHDHVILRVAKDHHPQNEVAKVDAIDLAIPSDVLLPTSDKIIDVWIRGYPFDAPQHGIDYDLKKISQQSYTTNGHIEITRSQFKFCYLIKMKTPILPGMHPNGMSGTPVYGVTNDRKPVYCGMIIKYNETTGEYLLIGPEILVNALKAL